MKERESVRDKMCVCVCVCEREREIDRERERERIILFYRIPLRFFVA